MDMAFNEEDTASLHPIGTNVVHFIGFASKRVLYVARMFDPEPVRHALAEFTGYKCGLTPNPTPKTRCVYDLVIQDTVPTMERNRGNSSPRQELHVLEVGMKYSTYVWGAVNRCARDACNAYMWPLNSWLCSIAAP